MKIKYVVLMLALVLFTACNASSDAKKFKKDYEALNSIKIENSVNSYKVMSISEKNPIKYTNYEEIFNIIDNKKDAVLFFGFPECPWCRSAIPVLLDIAKKENIKTIYYLNNKNDRDTKELDDNGKIITTKEGTSDYFKLLSKLGDNFDSVYDGLNDTSIKRLYFPTVMIIKKGIVVDYHVSTVDSQENPYIDLTSNQKQELEDIYNELFKKYKN